jgi:hypothetical protein
VETLSYQRGVEDEAETRTEVVIEGKALHVMVAVVQGSM